MKLVVKIGGALFKHDVNHLRINEYAQELKSIQQQGHRIASVTGGGENARRYIETARSLGANEAQCDQIGICVTRLNARLLISALPDDAFPEVPKSVEELRKYFAMGKIVVMGGLQPAQSTDAVATVVAESIDADVFIKTIDAPGVCTEDPKKYPTAKKLDEIRVGRLLEMLQEKSVVAGAYDLIDPVAVKVIERSKMPTWIVPGEDPTNLRRALNGERVGTRVIP